VQYPFLMEVVEVRYGINSTIFCIQFRKNDWNARLGGGVHTEAIIDGIAYNTAWIEMNELNMRQKFGMNEIDS